MTKLSFLVLLALVGGIAFAQRPAPDQVRGRLQGVAAERFHEAAGLFVAGDTVAAARAARAGLAAAPGDRALQSLLAAIERRPPPQPSGGGGQDDRRPPAEGDDQDRPADEGSGDSSRDRPSPGQAPPQDRRPEGGESGPRRGTPQPEPDDAGTPRPRMTRAEAEALLRALGADERRLLRARSGQVEPRVVENEW